MIDLWYEKVVYPLNNVRRGILNLIKWVPVLWIDRDWDYSYLFNIMIFKMNNLEKVIREGNRHLNTPRDMKSLRVCIELLKRIKEDNYYPEELDEIYKGVDLTDLSKSLPKEKEIKQRLYWKKTQRAYKEDADMFFRYFRRNFNRWWD